ncbi:MAG TPA: TIGR03118 family protein [Candidatus Sulfotelmatobacter sp.]|nr:TIGR03118 family protein [Candidatus Sulfotelmatobacter sp.]
MRVAWLAGLMWLLCAGSNAQVNHYRVTPIVNNTQDPYLVNPWGMSRAIKSTISENEWWTSDSVTGFTTLYYANQTGAASLAPLVIAVPSANGVGPGSPTGAAYNPGVGPGPTAENFTFASLDGLISNWNAGEKPAQAGTGCYQCHTNTTKVMVNRSGTGASYTGLTFATNATTKVPTYYAANHNGGVEAYNANTFARVTLAGSFSDPNIPSSYKPYGIQAEGGFILVTFFNNVAGGFVDAFDTNGNLKGRLARGSWFSEPWGMALAPANFGAFSRMLLVGNTTSGQIAAFDDTTGAFKGFLQDSTGKPIVLPGLWAIGFGNGNAESGPTTTLYYAAGGNYSTGEFGAITSN